MKCKWEHDEFCCNANCQYCADFCPCYEHQEICKYYEKKDETIYCIDCKHLMFSDMYGECNKQLRIVHPSDTCEHAEKRTEPTYCKDKQNNLRHCEDCHETCES